MSNTRWAVRPIALELVLYQFFEHQSGDALFQGGDDEVFINGTAFDTSELTRENSLPVHSINLPSGDVSDPAVNAKWLSDTSPYVVYRFDLTKSEVFPRTCSVQLQVVEEDNEGVAETFSTLDGKYRARLSQKVADAGAQAMGMLGEAVVPGSEPVVREVSKLILNEVVPIAFGALADAISSGLKNEVFMPEAFTMYLPNKDYDFNERNLFPGYYAERPPEWIWTPLMSRHVQTDNEHYEFVYYWKIQREILTYHLPIGVRVPGGMKIFQGGQAKLHHR